MTGKYLAARLTEVFLNGQWIAQTNYKEQLTNITWQQAIYKQRNLNSIAALAFHVNYYIKGLNQVFAGGNLDIKDAYSFDMPPVKSQTDWDNIVDGFFIDARTFIKHIEQMDEQQLNKSFVKTEYGSYLRNIEAQLEHAYYHLGQIVLIKKLMA
ncbi:MAG: DUF1572 family protein [Bacteroidia bacterium]|nr:DUF1572 family protein [Bacteroidia bacterium]